MPPITTRPARPARPAVLDPEILADGVRTFGAKPREIANLEYVAAGLIMTDLNGHRMIDVRKPDAMGRTGKMVMPTPGQAVPARINIPIYADPDDRTRTLGVTTGDPWTAEDLLFSATKLRVPPTQAQMRAWVSAADGHVDRAQRACRLLVHLATHEAGSMQAAAETTADGQDLVRMITDANLLGPGEVDRLITWRGKIPGYDDPRPFGLVLGDAA